MRTYGALCELVMNIETFGREYPDILCWAAEKHNVKPARLAKAYDRYCEGFSKADAADFSIKYPRTY